MKLLISFCNNRPGPHYGLLDVESRQLVPYYVDWPDIAGLTGIASTTFGYVLGVQRFDYGGLLFLDKDLKEIKRVVLTKSKDVHDVISGPCQWFPKDSLLVVSTGNDAIYHVTSSMLELPFYYFDKQNLKKRGWDHYHLNSVVYHRGQIFVSHFSKRKKTTDGWDPSQYGGIRVLGQPWAKLPAVVQPHSLLSVGSSLFYCDSARALLCNDQFFQLEVGGYPRGLAHYMGSFYVGKSLSRTYSRSTGKLNEVLLSNETRCGVVEISDNKKVNFFDLTPFSPEIYGIVVCE